MPVGDAHAEVHSFLSEAFESFGVSEKVRGGTADGGSNMRPAFALGHWQYISMSEQYLFGVASMWAA